MALPPCSRLPSVDQEYPWGPQGAHAGRTLRPQAPDGQRTRKEPPPRRTSQQVRTMPANHGRALKKRENSFESHIHAKRDWRGAVCDRRSTDPRTGRRPLGHPARAGGRGRRGADGRGCRRRFNRPERHPDDGRMARPGADQSPTTAATVEPDAATRSGLRSTAEQRLPRSPIAGAVGASERGVRMRVGSRTSSETVNAPAQIDVRAAEPEVERRGSLSGHDSRATSASHRQRNAHAWAPVASSRSTARHAGRLQRHASAGRASADRSRQEDPTVNGQWVGPAVTARC